MLYGSQVPVVQATKARNIQQLSYVLFCLTRIRPTIRTAVNLSRSIDSNRVRFENFSPGRSVLRRKECTRDTLKACSFRGGRLVPPVEL